MKRSGKIPVVQITLGGEVVDRANSRQPAPPFPQGALSAHLCDDRARRCFSVSDGVAGFPTEYFDSVRPDGIELQVRENESGSVPQFYWSVRSPLFPTGIDVRLDCNGRSRGNQ